MNATPPCDTIRNCFSPIDDPRVNRNKKHLLIDIINGLRRHSGGQTELGAGNRKIIGLAQDVGG